MPLLPVDVDNWYEVTDAVRQYPVVTFVNGHYHRDLTFSYDGIPGIANITNLRQKGNKQWVNTMSLMYTTTLSLFTPTP